jgi:SAM-dependent methyltransferase
MRNVALNLLRRIYHFVRRLTLRLLGASEPPPAMLKLEPGLVDDKHFEFPFVLEALRRLEAEGAAIIDVCDVGGADSVLTPMLAALGYRVTSCDIRPWQIERPNLRHVVDDIKQSSLPSASFDVVVAVSSLEHVGLAGRYGETGAQRGDHRAVQEIHRLLRPGGHLVLTVPYGRNRTLLYADGKDPRWQFALGRVYGPDQYRELIRGFEIVKQAFLGPPEVAGIAASPNVRFVECSEAGTHTFEPGARRHAIACALLRRLPRDCEANGLFSYERGQPK